MLLNNTKKTLIFSFCIFPLSNGIYESWNSLNEYELEKENFKSTYRKIEKSCIGFSTGILFGLTYTIFSPIILPGVLIAGIHTCTKQKNKSRN